MIKSLIDRKKEEILGPKPENWDKENPLKKPAKVKQEKPKHGDEEKKEEAINELYVPKDRISKMVSRDMVSTHNSKEILAKHHEATGGKVHTRFPPEPNGYLHIGHALAMRFSFTLAGDNGGNCYLRYDDTNPEKECQEYIDSIRNSVEWLGYKPWKTTYSSDYFGRLYEFAIQLIKSGKAFVCHQKKAEMKAD